MIKLLLAATALLALTSCQHSRELSVVTEPVKGAHCVVHNDKGDWVILRTPGNVSIWDDGSDITISCHKRVFYGEETILDYQPTVKIPMYTKK